MMLRVDIWAISQFGVFAARFCEAAGCCQAGSNGGKAAARYLHLRIWSCPVDQQNPGFICCPKGTSPNAVGQCKPWCPNGATDPKSQYLCGLGFDNATYNPNKPASTGCIAGGAPIAGKGILGCAQHSPVLNPQVCQAGWVKQNVPNVGELCQPTKQQMQCPPGQQISAIDGQCHTLCLGGTAWLGKQCCAPGSAVTATGQCCPAGWTVDPNTGKCGHLIFMCPPGSKPDPKTGVCNPPGHSCPPGSKVDAKTGECGQSTSSCLPGLSQDQVTGLCKNPPPNQSCAPSQQSNDGTCCKADWSPNKVLGGCCPPGQISGPGGLCKISVCFAPNKQIGGKCCSPGDLKVGGACATIICGVGSAPTGASNACCAADSIYSGKGGAQICCATPLINGQCKPAGGGVPVQPQCAPGSTDPNCCAPGYQAAGGSCCLVSQLTSTGQCCPTGQIPSGAKKNQCLPSLGGGIPPIGGGPGSLGNNGQCCASGSIPTASGVCCPANMVTSFGACCASGQMPDPGNRRACVPIQACGVRETNVKGACCSNTNIYTDALGTLQCCAQRVDSSKNICPPAQLEVKPDCFPGYTKTSDGSCCANNLVTRDGRCATPGSPQAPPVPRKETIPTPTPTPNAVPPERTRPGSSTVEPGGSNRPFSDRPTPIPQRPTPAPDRLPAEGHSGPSPRPAATPSSDRPRNPSASPEPGRSRTDPQQNRQSSPLRQSAPAKQPSIIFRPQVRPNRPQNCAVVNGTRVCR